LGGFLEATGPGASARADFSADGEPMVRWASGFLTVFDAFLRVFDRFLRAFYGNFALFIALVYA
jgi:hypothetical protein